MYCFVVREIPVYLDEPIIPAVTDAVVNSSVSTAKKSIAVDSCTLPVASATKLFTANDASRPVASVTNSVTSNDSSVPAINVIAANCADSCPFESTTNSLGDDDLATIPDGDDVEMLASAKRGVKRRWSFEENTIFKRAFQETLLNKKMPTGDEILSCSKEIKTRTVAQIRTRLNNIILGKQKLFC